MRRTSVRIFLNPSRPTACGSCVSFHMLKNGTAVRTIQLLLGHRSMHSQEGECIDLGQHARVRIEGAARSRMRTSGAVRPGPDDRPIDGNADPDCRRGNGSAARIHGAEHAGADGSERKSVFGPKPTRTFPESRLRRLRDRGLESNKARLSQGRPGGLDPLRSSVRPGLASRFRQECGGPFAPACL